MQQQNVDTIKRYAEKVFLVLLIASAFFSFFMIAQREWGARKEETIPDEQPRFRRFLDGAWVGSMTETTPPFAGVMIENMVEAQPLSGLARANLVFEAPTEANITRFLAFYTLEDDREIQTIGPVRSARPYYLDWASEFDTLYAHVGSSPEANILLRQIVIDGVHDFDQWYNAKSFFEHNGNGRRRPHHLYTSSALLRDAFAEKNLHPEFEQWNFKDDTEQEKRGSTAEITIGYQPPYDVTWRYHADENTYLRFQWGGVHTDTAGEQVRAKNIVVLFQDMEILDAIGRKRFTTIGEGDAIIFQDGKAIRGVWKKPGRRERTRVFDKEGNEIALNAGVTWVTIVPKGYLVTY